MRTRKRQLKEFSTNPGRSRSVRLRRISPLFPSEVQSSFDWADVITVPPACKGLEVTQDENHGLNGRLLRGKRFTGDVGGPFQSVKKGIRCNAPEVHCFENWKQQTGFQLQVHHWGPVLPISPIGLTLPSMPLNDLTAEGTTLVSRAKPTNSVADLAVSLAEVVREGIPSIPGMLLWKSKTRHAAKAGSEYLNQEFGWKPLVGGIGDTIRAITNAEKILRSYERNSGQIVRRSREFPEERTRTYENLGPTDGYVVHPGHSMTPISTMTRPTLYRVTETYRRVWFKGAFTYHLPTDYYSRNRLKEALAKAGPLMGLELTPEVVWNLTPWSWAIDWFSNAGDVVSNISDWATDGLVLKWGYVMEHQLKTVTYFLDGPLRYNPQGLVFAQPMTLYFESKRRVKATPFGFGVEWNSLTPRQLAIAAALGISRVF